MKKLSIRYKKRLLFSSLREEKKRQRHNAQRGRRNIRIIRLPRSLTLQDRRNHQRLCTAVANIKRWVKSTTYEKIILDFSHVESITPEGMLLLYAELDVINHLRGKAKFSIKAPINRRCAQVLRKIQFYELLGKKPPLYPDITDETVVHWVVLQNTNTKPEGWEKLAEQAGDVGLFIPVTEAIDNSIAHGYYARRDDFFCCEKAFDEGRKWWMFSQRKDGELHVALIDLGVGFSVSLKEQDLPQNRSIKNILQGIFGAKRWRDDEVLKVVVDAALEGGGTVTSTQEPHRGKGVAQICHLAKETPQSRLWIWSNKGGYCIGREKNVLHSSAPKKGVRTRFSHSINGTILYWSIPVRGET